MNTKDKIFAVFWAILIFFIIPISCYFISRIFYFIQDYWLLYLDFLSIYFDDLSAWLIAVISTAIFVIMILSVLIGDFTDSNFGSEDS